MGQRLEVVIAEAHEELTTNAFRLVSAIGSSAAKRCLDRATLRRPQLEHDRKSIRQGGDASRLLERLGSVHPSGAQGLILLASPRAFLEPRAWATISRALSVAQ